MKLPNPGQIVPSRARVLSSVTCWICGVILLLTMSVVRPVRGQDGQDGQDEGGEQAAEQSTAAADSPITLDRIMSDPDWLGRAPEAGYFAEDGASFYYRRKRAESPLSDWYQADLEGNLLRVVPEDEMGKMDADGGVYSQDRAWKAYERAGDIFVKHLETGRVRQLTRTVEREGQPQFMADGRRLMFRRGDVILARHLKHGLEAQLIDVRAEKAPELARAKSREGYLPEQQQRFFDVLRRERADADARRAAEQSQQAADPTRAPLPWYLGDSHRISRVEVSPNGRWCLVSLSDKQTSRGRSDEMPEFVAEDGYVNVRNVRPLVGTGQGKSDRLVLLDLTRREQFDLEFTELPELDSDPLAEVRAAADAWRQSQASEEQTKQGAQDPSEAEAEESSDEPSRKPAEKTAKENSPKETSVDRAVQVATIRWNDLGNAVAVELYSADNKDRWIASVDLRKHKLECLVHHRDPAWINWNVGRVDWLADHETVYYTTEATGYAQLYVTHVPSGATRQLTRGEFVVRDVVPSQDGKHLYYKANAMHPGVYEVYRVRVTDGAIETLTQLGGMNDFVLSPDEQHLLITHSTALAPPELWVQPVGNREAARQVTRTVSAEFSEMPWVAPQFVTVPSRAGRPIHARLYLPPGMDSGDKALDRNAGGRPAVIFIHGAGYLQNAHQGWSGYFREFMFHSLLARRGYVVLDMDYRASAGYGRDWRTSIYRHMGGPEVEDLLDGRQWLVDQHGVAADRVGLYGGSYGGFLTMMALFQQPGQFACGAALRPVTDWAHYNHGYTSNILNTPSIDPEAYARSSPIELAEGLADPLLICHGMVDDNVFFKDTARLAQRLIELKKEDWEVAIYPVEPHGFRQPSSWYDEYRRILKLFETHLRP